jgi:hypothetical protein
MDKAIDIYDGQGHHLAQLADASMTAVPAVAQLHPTLNWVAGVNSSGKLSLWM